MGTSAAIPSAPRAAAGNDVAMEKNTTVPPSAVASTAPCSAPGTSTHTTVTSAGVPTAAATASGSVASAITTRSASPAPVRAAASASSRTRPVSTVAPACRAAARLRQPDFPAAPSTVTARAAVRSTTRAVAAGAPQTSSRASETASGRSSGRTAAIDRAKRIAVPAAVTCSDRPSQRASPSVIRSGVSVSETRVATRWPTASPSGDSGPTASTAPMSMPPEPVTGFCIFPRVATMSRTVARTASPSPAHDSDSCRNEAASRFSRWTAIRTSSGAISGSASSRRAAWGSTPAGSRTRCTPSAFCTAVSTHRSCLTRSLQKNLSCHRRTAEDSPVGSPVLRRAAAPDQGGIVLEQPYEYSARELVEPDWRRLPGFADVRPEQWRSAQWQRVNCVKNLRQLRGVYGAPLDEPFYADVEADQATRATMSLLLPPQMLNTMVPDSVPTTAAMFADPVRRYMLPVASDRLPGATASHPYAARDSLHEHEMWAVEGLTHRYPTKVLAELLSTCPQYCGHCTRMDLVGNDVPQVDKLKFTVPQKNRHAQILDHLRRTPSVRDVVVSGGDIANLHITQLEPFVDALLDIPSIRDIRLASKGLIGLPQHFLQVEVLRGLERLAKKAFERGVDLALHCHANHAEQITPLVGRAVHRLLEIGFRDVRNQGVLLRGVNATAADLVEL